MWTNFHWDEAKKKFFFWKIKFKMADSKNWTFQLPPKAEQLPPKFFRLVLGLAGLIDAMGIDFAQPIWLWGWPTSAQKQAKKAFFVFLGCLCRYYLDSITLIETIVISSLCLFWSIHVKCQGHNHAGLCALHCRQYCCNQTTQARHSSWHTRKNSTIQLSFEFFIHLLPTIIAIKYWSIVPVLEDDEICLNLN